MEELSNKGILKRNNKENPEAIAQIESNENRTLDFNSKEWWTDHEIGKALNADFGRVRKLSEPYLKTNPEWFRESTGPMRQGKKIHRELAYLLRHEVDKSREIPKGWKTADDLSLLPNIAYSIEDIYRILKFIIKSFPDAKDHLKTLPKGKIYYSPEVCNAAVEQLRLYPLMPKEYQTVNQLAELFRSPVTRVQIPDIIKNLQLNNKIQ